MKTELLLGVWELISCEGRSAEGDSFLPYGQHPIGKLIYTNDRHLAVTLMSRDRPPFVSEDISRVTPDEVLLAFGSFDSYTGRWTLDEETSRIEHIIEAGRIPNWVGRTHVRYCSIENQQLTLTTEEFLMGGKAWRVYVRWGRPQ